jgi:hypothetical protein
MTEKTCKDNTFKPYSFKFDCIYCDNKNSIDGMFNFNAVKDLIFSMGEVCSVCHKMNELQFKVTEHNGAVNLQVLKVEESDYDLDNDYCGWIEEPELRTIDYLLDSLGEIEYIVRSAEKEHFTETIHKMAFTHAVTAMETYLCDTLIHKISTDDSTFINALKTVDQINITKNITEIDIAEKSISIQINKNVVDEVKQILKMFLYHNFKKVKNLYKKILDIDLPINKKIKNFMILRHNIVHRNGKTIEGNPIEITSEIVELLVSEIRSLAVFIDEQLN